MGYLAKVRKGINYRKVSLSSLKRCISVLVFVFCAFQVSTADAQLVYYQDTFRGGITGGGFSTGLGAGSGVVDLYIEPGSTVRKAYLLAFSSINADAVLYINSSAFDFNSENRVASFGTPASWFSPMHLHVIDVTNWLQSNFADSFNMEVPLQPGLPYEGVFAPFICIAYNNPIMPPVSVAIIGNTQDLIGNEEYSISNLNPINTQYPVGFSLYTDRTGSGFTETNEVYFNSTFLGVVGGSDNVNWQWNGAGVKGHFYYLDNQLFGLDDDVANNSMSGTDGLADVSDYLDNNATSCHFRLQHINYPNQSATSTNINLAYTLAYTTPCLPFETTLTEEVEICRGDTAHLLANGGIEYEWLPEEDLSCYNCPNPVFEGDSSKVYTVRIWNTDSCSKVLPVKVNVLDAPHSANLSTTPATCSEANGNLIIGSISGGQPAYQYSLGAAWTGNATATIFSNLPSGDYTFYVRDQNQCYYSQYFTIDEINPAHAVFTANPQSGTEPLDVNFYNQSSGTNQYEWTLQDSVSNDFDFNFTFHSAGTYLVQLISWYNEPHCADTAMATIIVHPTPPDYSHSIFIPTLYAPPMDNLFIETTNVQRVEFELYNAIGQHIYSTTLDVGDGQTDLWNGGRHARGYYFYRIKFWDVQGLEFRERGKVLLVR